MINYERQFLQSWDDVFYPRGPEMPEEPEAVQVAQAPVEGEGGAAFGVFPAARSRSRAPTSEAAKMMVPDVAAGAVKGTVTGAVGLPGDIESLVRGVRSIFQRTGDVGLVDSFLTGLEQKTILPTSEDVSKWLDANVGPVVPPGSPMAKERAGVAAAGQLAGEIASSPAALVKGAKAGGRAAKATAKFVAPKVGEMLDSYMRRAGLTPELMAFHGTPARFAPEEGAPMGRFRAEKIGTGEGAQAFGYGLYFAESPGVAAGYRATLSSNRPDRLVEGGKKVNPDTLYGRALEHAAKLKNSGWNADEAKRSALQQVDDSIRFNEKYSPDTANMYRSVRQQLEAADLSKVELQQGSLYTVDIPDEMVSKMLDWDKPLSQQAPEVVEILEQRSMNKIKPAARLQIDGSVYSPTGEPTGADIYNYLSQVYKDSGKASQTLKQLGIPGIRYLDQGSRGAGDGTRNIVVFPGEEDKVKILKVE